MIRRSSLNGSLLMELLVACLILSFIFPVLATSLSRMKEQHWLAQTYADQHKIKAAIDAHFQAQWSRLRSASCTDNSSLILSIGKGTNPPRRLANRSVYTQADWLQGTDYGLCRVGLMAHANPLEINSTCSWRVSGKVNFSSCEGRYKGRVLSTTSSKTRIHLSDITALGQSGHLESEAGFIWYLGDGKNGQRSLWRTPEESGNSLELWNGVEKLSILPLLDDNQDGLVDTLDAGYGSFSLSNVRGLWVEYQYTLNDCPSQNNSKPAQEYQSMRGDVWRYQAPCQAVGNHIIAFNRDWLL